MVLAAPGPLLTLPLLPPRACHASPTPGSRESRWNSSRRCRLLCVASCWVSRCEAVGEMARGLLHAGELLAATICASLRASRGRRICGASGARPRSRFTVDLSGGRPPHSKTRLTYASPGHRLRPVKCVFVCVSPHRCSAASVCPTSVARQATLFADGLPARDHRSVVAWFWKASIQYSVMFVRCNGVIHRGQKPASRG